VKSETHQSESPLRRLASSSVVYALTGFAQQSVGFLLMPIYTRVIPPAEYGILEMYTAFLSIAMMAVTLGLTSAINKVYHRDCETDDERQSVVATALMATLPLMVVVGGILLALADPISAKLTGDENHGGLLRIAVVSSLCNAVLAMVLGGLRAQERTFAFSTVSLVQFALALGLNVLLVAVVGLGVEGVLIGNLSANAAALALGMWMGRGGSRVAFDRRLVRPLFAFGVAIIPAMLSSWVMDVSDRYLLRLFRDLSEVAQYGVGYKFGLAVQALVTWPFQLAWPAVAFGISKDEGHEHTYARVLTYLLLVLMLVVLAFVGVSKSLLPIVIGQKYEPACRVVPIIAAAYALNALVYCVSPGIHVGGRTKALSVVGIVAAVSNIALCLVLIPLYGMMGAAWATVIAYAVSLAGATWLGQQSHPVRYERARIARIVAAGAVAYVLMRVVSAEADGAWRVAGQVGVLGVFLALVLASGFVATDERRYLSGLLHRYVLVQGRPEGA